jgi:FAD/FMN-containing dehydrogenase
MNVNAPVTPTLDVLRSTFEGSASIRPADAADAIDGVMPRFVVEPASAEALAAILAWASREGASVVLRGRGTRLGWGRPPRDIDVVLSLGRLNRVLAHAHGDLTATIEAGATIRDVNRELLRHRQWLPIDAADDDSTIGGAIATNDSGPLRHRHGTPRDLLIGVHLAMTDGRIVKAGGNVVKNVAGYDLGKLLSGSFGSLAAIVSATFKLAPLPVASATAVAMFRSSDATARAAASVSASQLEPAAFEVHVRAGRAAFAPLPREPGRDEAEAGTYVASGVPPSLGFGEARRPPSFAETSGELRRDLAGALAEAGSAERGGGSRSSPYVLLVQFASTQAAIDSQVDQLRALVAADSFDLVTGDAERDVWQRHMRAVWAAPGVIVRASWLPANLAAVLTLVNEMAGQGADAIEIAGRAGVGAGMIRIDGSPSSSLAAIERLRSSPDALGHVVLLRAAPAVKHQVDVWGAAGNHAALLRAVKRAFDPAGILNAGRGPI